jgi:hypothetical protein
VKQIHLAGVLADERKITRGLHMRVDEFFVISWAKKVMIGGTVTYNEVTKSKDRPNALNEVTADWVCTNDELDRMLQSLGFRSCGGETP